MAQKRLDSDFAADLQTQRLEDELEMETCSFCKESEQYKLKGYASRALHIATHPKPRRRAPQDEEDFEGEDE